MKLSTFARREGVTYLTAYRWWRLGYLNGKQVASGTILIDDINPCKERESAGKEDEQPNLVLHEKT